MQEGDNCNFLKNGKLAETDVIVAFFNFVMTSKCLFFGFHVPRFQIIIYSFYINLNKFLDMRNNWGITSNGIT